MKYRKLQTVHENTKFLIFNYLENYLTKKLVLVFFLYQYLSNYNIFLNVTYHNTYVCVQDMYWYPFYIVFISTYINKGIAKVSISTKIGVRFQGLTSKIWNSPLVCIFFYVSDNKILWAIISLISFDAFSTLFHLNFNLMGITLVKGSNVCEHLAHILR